MCQSNQFRRLRQLIVTTASTATVIATDNTNRLLLAGTKTRCYKVAAFVDTPSTFMGINWLFWKRESSLASPLKI